MTRHRTSIAKHNNGALSNALMILLFVAFWPIGVILILKNRKCRWFEKWYVVLAAVLYVVVFSSFVTASAKQSAQSMKNRELERNWQQMIDEEMSRDYYIDVKNPIVDGVIAVDCNMQQTKAGSSIYDGSDDIFQCKSVDIAGEFSKYDSTKLVLEEGKESSLDVSGSEFVYSDNPGDFSSSMWSTSSFDVDSYRTRTDTVKFIVRNTRINSGWYDVCERTVKVVIRLSDEELAILRQHNDNYNKYVAEQKRIAEEQEAKRKAEEEARKQQEEAEQRAKEEAEKQAAEEKKRQEEAQKQVEQSSQQQTTTQSQSPENNQSAINEGRAACAAYLEYAGFPNANIKVSTVHVYSDGTPTGIYIQGQATYDPGIAQSEVSIGTINCRYDTASGSVLGIWKNGVAL